MFKSFSQSRGRSLFRHLFGHSSPLYSGKQVGNWVAHITGASGDVPISAARFWSLDYLIFMRTTFFVSGCSRCSGFSTVHTAGSTGLFWAHR